MNRKIKDIGMWEETDSELAKYNIQQLQHKIKEYEDRFRVIKEIVEANIFEDINNFTGFKDGAFKYYLGKYEANILLDYITNLEKISNERMNTILKIEQYLIANGVDDEMLECCDIYDVNGIELRKYIEMLKGEDNE